MVCDLYPLPLLPLREGEKINNFPSLFGREVAVVPERSVALSYAEVSKGRPGS
jgi:hypothetical protein